MPASLTDKITDVRNSDRPNSTTASGSRAIGGDTLACASLTGWPTASKVHFVTYQTDTNNDVIAGTQLDCYGIVAGNTITNFTILDGTDGGNSVGDKVEMLPTAGWAQDLADGLMVSHNRDGSLADGAVDSADVLAVNVVTTPKILDSNVTTAKIADANVTNVKLESGTQTKLGYLTAPDSGWITPTLLNGWVTYDTNFMVEGYRIDALGYVHLKGMIKNGSGIIFKLPSGYRPPVDGSRRLLLQTITSTGQGRIDITSDGNVTYIQGGTGWFSLDGITFKAGT